jgi:iron(III) transport system permease protein
MSAGVQTAPASLTRPQRIRQVITREEWLMRGLIALTGLWLVVSVVLPLSQIVWRSLVDRSGAFVGLENYRTYFTTPALATSFYNSLYISTVTTIVAVGLGYLYAYAISRTAMRGKSIFRVIAMLPLYAPSLVHAIALIYLFGNQGIITTGFFGALSRWLGTPVRLDIGLYGPVGIILGEIIYCFPQAFLIMVVAFTVTDARLYEASAALRGSRLRTFLTVTLPGIRFGLISASFVCFILAFTDFGVPKVVGGSYNVLATDIYKQVIGQQNFTMGSTIGIVLLLPTVIAFIVDRIAQQRQVALLSSRAVPLTPKPNRLIDTLATLYCSLVAAAVLLMLGTAVFASLVKVWPYDFTLTLRHYEFRGVAGGYSSYWNSVRMAIYTAIYGTAVVFLSAYLVEKGRGFGWGRQAIYFLSILPVALPGLVLGLAYIFFFNIPGWRVGNYLILNPLNTLYGTMTILVISNIIHFYTVSFLAATTALKQMDAEFEAVGASLSVPFYRTFWRVTVPVCLPTLLEVAMYFFVNGMVTVSAVIFLYSPALKLASVAVVNMDDAGQTASAAAMSILIVVTCLAARLLYSLATYGIQRRTQAWRTR